MADSLRIGPDAQINEKRSSLRNSVEQSGDIGDDATQIAAGIKVLADPALKMGGSWSSPEGRLVELSLRPEAEGEWLALHIDLPTRDLAPFGMLGIAARVAAKEMRLMRACLRSGTESGFVDCFFDKHLMAQVSPRLHLDVIAFSPRDDLPLWAPWREVVLFLPTEASDLSLIDLRVFIL